MYLCQSCYIAFIMIISLQNSICMNCFGLVVEYDSMWFEEVLACNNCSRFLWLYTISFSASHWAHLVVEDESASSSVSKPGLDSCYLISDWWHQQEHPAKSTALQKVPLHAWAHLSHWNGLYNIRMLYFYTVNTNERSAAVYCHIY